MSTRIPAPRLAALVEPDRHGYPAYRALADAIRALLVDGRLVVGSTLPSERSFTAALGVSRTTVTRAYQELVADGYATARQGSGTVLRFPGDGPDRLSPFGPRATDPDDDRVDLTCAASPAPPGVVVAAEAALADLCAHARGIGYHPVGTPELREAIAARYRARGVPTDVDQVLVVPGALSAVSVVARALLRPGERVVVESPSYPNTVEVLAASGARLVPVGLGDGEWDLDEIEAAVRRHRPRLAMFIPDFQNPTGALMSADTRRGLADTLRRGGTTAVVDESMVDLVLDETDGPMPPPYAAFDRRAVSIGSVSKSFWGGLRIGWIRAPHDLVLDLTEALATVSLGCSVMDELITVRLLADEAAVLADRRATMRAARDVTADLVRTHLPSWTFRLPRGGLSLWCRMPEPLAVPLAVAAERRGVFVVPGLRFSAAGGMAHHLRIPYAGGAETVAPAIERITAAYGEVAAPGAACAEEPTSASGQLIA